MVELAQRGDEPFVLSGFPAEIFKLLFLLVFNVAQYEDEVLAFSWLQLYLYIVRGNGTPTVSQ